MFRKLIFNIQNNYFEYTLYFLVASFFFGNAVLSIASALFYFILLFGTYSKLKYLEFFSVKPFILMGLYFILILILLCFLSKSISEFLVIQKYLPFILFPFIFLFNKKQVAKKKISENVSKIFISSAIISFSASFFYGVWRMFFFQKNISVMYITYKFLTDLFGVHQIYLSVFYVLAILFCIDLSFDKSLNKVDKKYVFYGIFLFLAVLLLSSRTTILACFILVFIKIVWLKLFSVKKLIFILFSIFLISSVLTLSVPTLRVRIINLNENISSYSGLSFRVKVWKNVIEIYKDSPVYGFGPKKSQDVLLKHYHEINFRRAFLKNFNAHNQYLQTLLDTGLLGLTILVFLLISPFFYFKNKLNFMLFTILILLSLISESFLIRQSGIIFYCLFFSIFALEREDLVLGLKSDVINK